MYIYLMSHSLSFYVAIDMYLVNDELNPFFLCFSLMTVHGWIRLLWNGMHADTTCTVDINICYPKTHVKTGSKC